jgi:Fe-S-cluster-containing hydrogenase component 2
LNQSNLLGCGLQDFGKLRPEIDWKLCQGCDPCEARLVCKTRAIMQLDPGEPVFIELGRCNGCNKCVPACVFSAIILNKNHYAFLSHDPE